MKIIINSTTNEIKTVLTTVADGVRVFEPEAIKDYEVDKAIFEITHCDVRTRYFPGGSCTNDRGNLTINLDEEMIKDLAPVIIKGLQLVAPIYHSGKAFLMTIKSISKSMSDSFSGISKGFCDKWGFTKKYQVVVLKNAELGIYDVAVLEDDGKNKLQIVHIEHAGEFFENMIIQRHMVDQMGLKPGTSKITTRDEAVKTARNTADRYRNYQKTDEDDTDENADEQ